MSSIEQKIGQFIANEQSVGISLQSFKQKFVFNSNSGPDAFYLDVNSPTPSQLIGMTKKQQNMCLFLMSQMLFKAGEMLKLPVSTTIVALNISQYYYTRKAFFDYDFREILLGAMFLACKSQETLRRSYQIASVFDYIFKMYQGLRNIKELQLNSLEYNYMKEKVTKTQNQILFELGFEVYRLFDIPHRYIGGLVASFNKHKQCNLIVQYSWSYLNDIYRTKAAVLYPGQIIAASALFLALQKLSIPFPEKPWWILMEASIKQIKQICILTNQMYQISMRNQININKISQILQKVGKQSLNVSNVLPVPYYRKIRLDNQGLVMKKIDQILPISQQKNIVQKMQSQKEENQNQTKQRSKKQKKKDKKKHKHHKHHDRSKSRSPDKNTNYKKGKFQNDEQTPKIKRTQNGNLDIKKQWNEKAKLIVEQKIQISTQKIVQQINERKGSQGNVTDIKSQVVKKPGLLDVKSMLSKISQQIKKIQVKNEMVANISNQKNESQNKVQKMDQQNGKYVKEKYQNKSVQDKQSSSEEEEDQLLAQLIQIKKKNLQKKDEATTN